jgi:hypothetical protein
MFKIAFVILTCHKNYETKMRSIKETWLSDVPESNFIFLADHMDIKNRMFYDSRARLGYDFVPEKYFYFFCNPQVSFNIDDFDFFFFADDDTFVNTRNLEKICKKMPNSPAWAGVPIVVNSWETTEHRVAGEHEDFPELGFDYPSGGSGFLINRSLFKQVSSFVLTYPRVPGSRWSDMTFGVWKEKSGGALTLNETGSFYWDVPQSLEQEFHEQIRDSITYHRINEEMHHRIWNIVQSKFENSH